MFESIVSKENLDLKKELINFYRISAFSRGHKNFIILQWGNKENTKTSNSGQGDKIVCIGDGGYL